MRLKGRRRGRNALEDLDRFVRLCKKIRRVQGRSATATEERRRNARGRTLDGHSQSAGLPNLLCEGADDHLELGVLIRERSQAVDDLGEVDRRASGRVGG